MADLTLEQLEAQHQLLWSDPEKYLELLNEVIRDNPDDSHAYFHRHFGWDHMGRLDQALNDLDRSIALKGHATSYLCRGNILYKLARYREALAAYDQAENVDPYVWRGFRGFLNRAACHAQLGNEAAALADCARLPDNNWLPNPNFSLAMDKPTFVAEIRQRALMKRHSSR